MYLAPLESVITVINEYGYLPGTADIGIDLTNIMWYGRFSNERNEKGKPLNRDRINHEDQPIGVGGVNERARSTYPFQIASVSLANVEIPVTLAAKSIKRPGASSTR